MPTDEPQTAGTEIFLVGGPAELPPTWRLPPGQEDATEVTVPHLNKNEHFARTARTQAVAGGRELAVFAWSHSTAIAE
ncbi:DUF5988 family protein [Streptomyces syringium]|uniref:DUF5988 family protein n=1 Tax=Streptomyces syringium TaxID=76729 RepID=UPI00339E1685